MPLKTIALAAMVAAPDPQDINMAMADIPATMAALSGLENSAGWWPEGAGFPTNQDSNIPPPSFNVPYAGTIHVRLVFWWNIARACSAGAHACELASERRPGDCYIVLPAIDALTSAIAPADIQAAFLHERAHCNGWAASHPHDGGAGE